MSLKSRMKLMYLLGADLWRDRVLINWADDIALGRNQEGTFSKQWKNIYKLANTWERPVFPLKGADVLDMGMEIGPSVGYYLNNVEEWWIQNDFLPNRNECLLKLKGFISSD